MVCPHSCPDEPLAARTGTGRGFPTDFPVVGYSESTPSQPGGRGFPTDFPVVG